MAKRHPRNISRYRHHRYEAWIVQIRRRGRFIVRYFADRRHGGRGRALAAAAAFRDHLLDRLPPLSFAGLHPRGPTGVVGVCVQVNRLRQGTYRSYVASWPDAAGGRHTRTFAFKKYGKARAFELAVQARRRGLADFLRTIPRTRPLNRPRAPLRPS